VTPDISEPPLEGPPPGIKHPSSLVLVNTGDGKGKTTAALGTAMRALARGWRVAVIQFMKSDKWKVGEEKIGRELGIDWWTTGDGFTWDSENLDETEAKARAAWNAAIDMIAAGEHEMIVLDEFTYPINFGWIPVADVVEVISQRPPHVNVIVTGRDAPSEVSAIADTVTEMTKIRHAFDSGVAARRGIDF
jgi:cob(I)alamin adenosyltransferase